MPLYDVYRADGSVTSVEASSKSAASAAVRYAGEAIRRVVEVSPSSSVGVLVEEQTSLPAELPAFLPYVGEGWQENWQLIGRVEVKAVSDLDTVRSWDNQFRAGERGVFTIHFPIPLPNDLPDWLRIFGPISMGAGTPLEFSKNSIARQVKSVCEAKGIELWKDPDWDASRNLRVFYTVGFAPVAIAIIVVGALIAVGIIAVTISNYKIKEQEVLAYNERQREINDAFLDAVNEVEDPAQRAKLLDDKAQSDAESYGVGKTPSLVEAGVEVFKTPALVIGIGIAALIVTIAVVKAVKK